MNAGDIFQQIWDYATTQWQALTFQIVITIATAVLGALFARASKSLGGLFQKLEIDFGSVLYFTLFLVGPGAIVAGVVTIWLGWTWYISFAIIVVGVILSLLMAFVGLGDERLGGYYFLLLIQPTIAVIGFIGALTTQGDSPYLTIFTVGCAWAGITAISGLFNSDSFLAASLDSWALVLLGFTAAIISIVSSVQHNSTQCLILTVDSLILTLVVLVAAVAASIYLLIRVLIQGMEVVADELAKQEAKGIVDAVESPKLLSGSTTRDSSAPDE